MPHCTKTTMFDFTLLKEKRKECNKKEGEINLLEDAYVEPFEQLVLHVSCLINELMNIEHFDICLTTNLC